MCNIYIYIYISCACESFKFIQLKLSYQLPLDVAAKFPNFVFCFLFFVFESFKLKKSNYLLKTKLWEYFFKNILNET